MTLRPSASGKLAILAAGGPAPGINSVIGAATIRARLAGVEVLGMIDGFRFIAEGDASHVLPLEIHATSRIHFRGGSHIGISRGGPIGEPENMKKALDVFQRLGVTMLITIGGDGTAWVARQLSLASAGTLRVVHVPKTIDNDIDLPNDIPTFGFQTARHVGVGLVENLMVDAKTTSRWYFVVAQGRKSGHLALSIGKAAGATISLIPEEFERGSSLAALVDTLVGAIIKRIADGGRKHGVAMLAEGLAGVVREEDLARYTTIPRDQRGNIAYAQIRLGEIIDQAVSDRLKELSLDVTIHSKELGYELRCADPIPFDMEYTRDLGYSAARFILEGGDKAMVSMQNGRFCPISFDALMDPVTGRSRVRMVDLRSDRYRIAREYMVRLKKSDFEGEMLKKLADVCAMAPTAFKSTFWHVTQVTQAERLLDEAEQA